MFEGDDNKYGVDVQSLTVRTINGPTVFQFGYST